MTAPLDLLVLGNAIVDILARTDEAFLVREAVHKGAMQLIDEARAEHLFAVMGPATIVSGGSGANTAVGAAQLGAKTGFIGKVRDDELGRLFRHDLTATGVQFGVAPATEGPATARCFILVTPDGERTMNTYLGACQGLTAADVDEATAASARFVYLEGYLWDPPAAKDAFRKAARLAHQAGNQVALTLSDPFCVDRYRDEFLGLIRDGSLDILFANIHELKSLYQTADAATALEALRAEEGLLGVVTCSAEGALVVTRAETRAVPASPIRELVDTTGAGDLFAAGFLAGLARNLDHGDCARLGAIAAAEVIQHIGARPQTDLNALAAQSGL
ncbi:adenosine kinase [Methylobacterium nodulans]|uniref:PfkB domain protein n=1 Tax=Methylobacterium nodulans (strain LMG 21967 / CNCM I-2342 / ORS 2060) TaxID=460265 RepID=B8IKQ4_METNO|nr:adenosine kinase [Methylobacterium nodulans]ACL56261.1 PfkB domain protein [Methylobacterium nodulans ORS 2060]